MMPAEPARAAEPQLQGASIGAEGEPKRRLGGIVVDDDAPPSDGQMARSPFLLALAEAVRRSVEPELRRVGRTTNECPYLEYWLNHYRTRSAAEVERAVLLYAQPSSRSPSGLLEAIATRAASAARRWVEGHPVSLPASLPEPPPLDVLRRHLASLGVGQALEPRQRARFEPVLGALGDVRIHLDQAAAALAERERAFALTIGQHVVFGRDHRPGTPIGDALLAHELAHTRQQPRDPSAPVVRADAALEEDAQHGAVHAMLGTTRPYALARAPGLTLQRCGPGDPAARDWKAELGVEYEAQVTRIQELRKKQLEILSHPKLSEQDSLDIAQVQADLQAAVAALQALGVNLPTDQIITGVLAGKDLRTFDVLKFSGDEPASLIWGERRKLGIALSFLPKDVDVQYGWWFRPKGGKQEQVFQVPLVANADIALDEQFWLYWETPFGVPPDPRMTSHRPENELTIGVDVFVGKEKVASKETRKLTIAHTIPTDLSISAPRIVSVAPTIAAAPELATAADSTPTAPKTIDYVLQNTDIEFVLSWIPLTGLQAYGSSHPAYAVVWFIDDESKAAGADRRQWQSQVGLLRVGYKFPKTGDYTVGAEIHDARWIQKGIAGFAKVNTNSRLTATRRLKVASQDELGGLVLDRYKQQVPKLEYSTQLADLDKQTASATRTLAAGSANPAPLREHREQLMKMRERLADQMGDVPTLAFPAKEEELTKTSRYSGLLHSVIAHPEYGGAYPLTTFLRLYWDGSAWSARIIDSTTQDVTKYDGTGSTPRGAIVAAIETWRTKNQLPRGGEVLYSFSGLGLSISDKFSTSTTAKWFWEWFDRILFIGQAIVGIVLLLTPEPTGVTKVAGLALLGVGLLRSGHRLYQSLNLGRPFWSQENVIEAVSIVAGLIGLGGGGAMVRAAASVPKGVQLTGSALTVFRIGEGMIITTALIDTGTFVYATNAALEQLRKMANDPNIPASQKYDRMLTSMAQLAAQGLLTIGMNSSLFRSGKPVGTGQPTFLEKIQPGKTIELDPAARTAMELELKRLGSAEDVTQLKDHELVQRYVELNRAHVELQLEAEQKGAVLGKGAFELGPEGSSSVNRVRNVVKKSSELKSRLDGKATYDPSTATMKVETTDPSGAKTTVEVEIRYEVKPNLDAAPAPASHGAEAGPARLRWKFDGGKWTAVIELDSRLQTADDIRVAIGHELDEMARIVEKKTRDPSIDIAAEMEARVFRAGATSGPLSAHDSAQARQLRTQFELNEGAFNAYDMASVAENRGKGPMPSAVRDAFDTANKKMTGLLDLMGFIDPRTRAAKRKALLDEVGLGENSSLARYLDYYASQVDARARLRAYEGSAAYRGATGTSSELSPELVAHLTKPGTERGVLARGTAGDFENWGVPGGHDTGELRTFETLNPQYAFVAFKKKTAGGTEYTLHIQYEARPGATSARPPGDVSASATGPFPNNTAAMPAYPGWKPAKVPKTTALDFNVFLGEVEGAFRTWSAGTGGAGASAPAFAGKTSALIGDQGSTSSMTSPSGLKLGGRAVWNPGTGKFELAGVWIESSWF